jgi:hypothetical protein
MPIVLERDIEEWVRVKALSIGVPSLKLSLRYMRDWPDRMFLLPGGRPYFIEFKRPGNVPTPKQHRKMEELRKLGYDVDWFDNREKAFAAICAKLETVRVSAQRGAVPVRTRSGRAVP